MDLRDGDEAQPASLVEAPWTERVIWVCGFAVLVIGVLPAPFLAAAKATVGVLGGP
jgi:hypothetical protein